MQWRVQSKTISANGRIIVYDCKEISEMGLDIRVESILEHVPHSGREGTWDCRTYWLLVNGEAVKQTGTLKGAKEAAEILAKSLQTKR